jgi:hypothetical protein
VSGTGGETRNFRLMTEKMPTHPDIFHISGLTFFRNTNEQQDTMIISEKLNLKSEMPSQVIYLVHKSPYSGKDIKQLLDDGWEEITN